MAVRSNNAATARVVSLSGDTQSRNFTLGQGQWDGRPATMFGMRLRTTATDNNGQPDFFTPEGTASTSPTHVLYTRDAGGAARLYINGSEVASTSTPIWSISLVASGRCGVMVREGRGPALLPSSTATSCPLTICRAPAIPLPQVRMVCIGANPQI